MITGVTGEPCRMPVQKSDPTSVRRLILDHYCPPFCWDPGTGAIKDARGETVLRAHMLEILNQLSAYSPETGL